MSDQRSIEIDFEVNKRIEMARKSFAETPNAVLRRLLKIEGPAPQAPRHQPVPGGRPWSSDGVTLAHGTELRMKYNGRVHTGSVRDGVWWVEGNAYKSPSGAAGGVARTKKGKQTNLDGWGYWEARRPGATNWVPIGSLRQH
jgi:hypothetical protein